MLQELYKKFFLLITIFLITLLHTKILLTNTCWNHLAEMILTNIHQVWIYSNCKPHVFIGGGGDEYVIILQLSQAHPRLKAFFLLVYFWYLNHSLKVTRALLWTLDLGQVVNTRSLTSRFYSPSDHIWGKPVCRVLVGFTMGTPI